VAQGTARIDAVADAPALLGFLDVAGSVQVGDNLAYRSLGDADRVSHLAGCDQRLPGKTVENQSVIGQE